MYIYIIYIYTHTHTHTHIYIYIYILVILSFFFFVEKAFISNTDDTVLHSIQKTHILNQSVLKKNFMYLKK